MDVGLGILHRIKALYLNLRIDALVSHCELILSCLGRWIISNDGFVISLKLSLFK